MEKTLLEKLSDYFRCKFCGDIYTKPVLLPCGHRICEKDLLAANRQITCQTCKQLLNIEEDTRYLIDKDFNLLGQDIGGLDGILRKSDDSIENLNVKIKDLEKLTIDPENFVYDYFSEFRNKLDVEREEIKHEIDIHFLGLIYQLSKFEEKCRHTNLQHIECEIKVFNDNLSKLKSESNLLNKDFKKLNEIVFKTSFEHAKVDQLIKQLKNDLVNGIDVCIDESRTKFKKILKDIKIKENSTKCAFSPGFFQFIKTDFMQFYDQKDSFFKTPGFIYNNARWYVKLENESSANCVFYFYSDSKDFSLLKKAGIDYSYVIELKHSLDASKNVSTNVKRVEIKPNRGIGKGSSISFQDMFENGYYNSITDSIEINVFVQTNDE